MKTLKNRLGLFVALSLATLVLATLVVASPTFAQISFNIRIGPPPPPPREVIVAAPFPGAIWVPGYYVFDYAVNQYRWHPGAWMRPPSAGAVWIAPRYVQRGRYYGYVAGRWATPAQVRARAARRGYRNGRAGGGGWPVREGRAPMAR